MRRAARGILPVAALAAALLASPASPASRLLMPPGATVQEQAVAEACRRGLGSTRGSVVAMDPRDGRVLALVNPVYGMQHAYQPCSVFKLVVGLAGLAEGEITPRTHYHCDGGCWAWPGHGAIDLRRALAVSCNPFFQRVGAGLGWSTVRGYATLLGLGRITGVNLTGETPGRLPQRVSAARVGLTSSHAIGIRTTALQLAVLVSATVNGGVLYEPRLARAEAYAPQLRSRLPAELPLEALTAGYYSAVTEGSAFGAFGEGFTAGGKTGSCSGVGWLASFAPVDNPRLTLVVFLRRGNGRRAAQIAGRIYGELFGPAGPLRDGADAAPRLTGAPARPRGRAAPTPR